MRIDILAAVLVLAPAGVLAGAGARWWLARLRRGARVRAPVCEIGVGVPWAAAGAAWGGGVLGARWLPLLLGLSWLAVTATVVDVRHRRLPDALTLPAAALAPAALVPLGAGAVGRGLLAGLAAVVAHAVVHLAAPAALGAGDVKLAGSLGAAAGGVSWAAPMIAAVTASVLTLLSVAAVVAGDAWRRRRAPPRAATGAEAAAPPRGPGTSARGQGTPPRGPGRVAARVRAVITCGCATAGPAEDAPVLALPPVDRGRAGPLPAGQQRRGVAVPHGPSMLAAAWLVVAAAAVAGGAG